MDLPSAFNLNLLHFIPYLKTPGKKITTNPDPLHSPYRLVGCFIRSVEGEVIFVYMTTGDEKSKTKSFKCFVT
jgi:hypothetical protein